MADDKPPRPPAKDRVASTRIPPEVYDAAARKAAERGSTISKILRAFLFLFSQDETPPGWPPEIADQEIRAAKRPRPRKRGKGKGK
jgi:hypothetical protein